MPCIADKRSDNRNKWEMTNEQRTENKVGEKVKAFFFGGSVLGIN